LSPYHTPGSLMEVMAVAMPARSIAAIDCAGVHAMSER
jgi:hypothetical protein